MNKKNIILGAHVSISGGLHKAIERGEELECKTIQIFTKSSRSWFEKKLDPVEIEKFKLAQKNSSIKFVVSHCSYLINIGSSNPETEKKSTSALKHELHRCEQLAIPYLVLHPGSHTGSGEEKCIKKIAKNLDSVLKTANGKTMILLETMAGQGTNIGYKFEQIKEIKSLCKYKKLLGVCFDTCHAYSAGYDFGTEAGYKKVFNDYKKILGIKSLKVIHMNDSKTELGSRKDRHENIGKGSIPRKAFQFIMNDPNFSNIPIILETPTDSNMTSYRSDMKTLLGMTK